MASEDVVARLRAVRDVFAWAREHLGSYVGDGTHIDSVAGMMDLTADADADLARICMALGVAPLETSVLPRPSRIPVFGNAGARDWLARRIELTDELLGNVEPKDPTDRGPYR